MPLTPLQAIRQNCLDCMCGNAAEVSRCPMESKCTLFPYRFGHNPHRKGLGKIENLTKPKSENGTGEYKDTTPAPKNPQTPTQ